MNPNEGPGSRPGPDEIPPALDSLNINENNYVFENAMNMKIGALANGATW